VLSAGCAWWENFGISGDSPLAVAFLSSGDAPDAEQLADPARFKVVDSCEESDGKGSSAGLFGIWHVSESRPVECWLVGGASRMIYSTRDIQYPELLDLRRYIPADVEPAHPMKSVSQQLQYRFDNC
jgi:hypothetical protein